MNKHWFTTCLLAFPVFAMAENTSPWLPIPGEVALTLNSSTKSGDDAYFGGKKDSLGGSFDQINYNVIVGYGLNDSVAVDATVSYAKIESGDLEEKAFADSTIGLSWRVLDEYASAETIPTITLRAGVIVAGDYDGEKSTSIGKAENGYQLSVIAGRKLNPQWSVVAELGYEYRAGDVPEASFAQASVSFSPLNSLGLTLGYSSKKYGGDLNLRGPGFTTARYQEVNEERDLVKFNVGYAFAANQGIALSFSTLVEGRNTVNDDQNLGLSYTYAF